MKTIPLFLAILIICACESDPRSTTVNPTDTSTETGAAPDADVDADTDADSDADTDADTDSDTDSDTTVDSVVDTGLGDCPSPPTAIETTTSYGNATRYWDCCKPHCSWRNNNPGTLVRSCDINDAVLSNPTLKSGCESGGTAYTCWDMNPWQVCDTVSYGFVATAGNGDVTCGTCFEIVFDGKNNQMKYDQNAKPDAGSAQLLGKTMIVQATNIGYDVGSGHFDFMIPGGGVGAFPDGCPKQWGTTDQNLLGAGSGGFLTTCQQKLGWEATATALQTCVRDMCNALFGQDPSKADLLAGCIWYVEWFGVADNPTFNYRKVECPAALRAKGM